MQFIVSIIVIITIFSNVALCADIFTTIQDLKSLSDIEDVLIDKLEEHLKSSEERLRNIKSFVAALKPQIHVDGTDPLKVAGHPVDAYQLVKNWHHRSAFGLVNFPSKVRQNCSDNHDNCEEWAKRGECDANPLYMLVDCKRACKVCFDGQYNGGEIMKSILKEVGSLLPDENDITGAQDALLRLQSMYNLTANEIRRGIVLDQKATQMLNAQDCISLGIKSIEANDYSLALQWFDEARQASVFDIPQHHSAIYHTATLYEQMHDTTTAYHIALEAFNGQEPDLSCVDLSSQCTETARYGGCIQNPAHAQNVCPLSCQFCEATPSSVTYHNELAGIIARGKASMQKENCSFDHTPLITQLPSAFSKGYEALCQRQTLGNLNLFMKQNASCKYVSSTVPWFNFKMEALSRSPFIAVIYDVITDSEATYLKEMAKHKLHRSQVAMSEAGNSISKERISKQTFVNDDKDRVVSRLSSRVELITGLDTTALFDTPRGPLTGRSADAMQVVNYGIGGHYDLHHDYLPRANIYPHLAQKQKLHLVGDRIATFMFYLNDVLAGGNTVFPELDIAVQPIKNAASFWYNAAPSGEYDTRTFHGGCPVLLGEKWVANKWIREFGNTFTRKCGLQKDFPQDF